MQVCVPRGSLDGHAVRIDSPASSQDRSICPAGVVHLCANSLAYLPTLAHPTVPTRARRASRASLRSPPVRRVSAARLATHALCNRIRCSMYLKQTSTLSSPVVSLYSACPGCANGEFARRTSHPEIRGIALCESFFHVHERTQARQAYCLKQKDIRTSALTP